MSHLPVFAESDPRSEVDLWTSGRGPNVLHRSTAPPAPPAESPPAMSTLLLEELRLSSELVLLNQPLHKHYVRLTRGLPPLLCQDTLKQDIECYLRCCFGELCGVLDGVDWAEELCLSSLASTL